MNTEIFDRTRNVVEESIREIAELDDTDAISDELDLSKDLGVDSLMAVDLIIYIERELNIVMPEEDVTKVRSVGDLVTLISRLIKVDCNI